MQRIRVDVRNQQSGRIIGFVYYDLQSWNKGDLMLTAFDDGKKLVTGLYLPHTSVNRSLLQVLFSCKYSEIDDFPGKLLDF